MSPEQRVWERRMILPSPAGMLPGWGDFPGNEHRADPGALGIAHFAQYGQKARNGEEIINVPGRFLPGRRISSSSRSGLLPK